MKRPLFGFRTVLALGLLALLATAGGVLWWKHTEREREIRRLRQAIEHLTASYPIARLVVDDQQTDESGATLTSLRLSLVDEQGRRKGGPGAVELAGRRVYFEALLIVFDDPLVESGQRRAMAFPTRLYTESIPPSDGYALQVLDDRGVPSLYERSEAPPGGLSLSAYRDVLRRFWELANDPAQASSYGIDVLQGQAVFTEYEVGRFYTIFVEADGGLTIRPELHWLE